MNRYGLQTVMKLASCYGLKSSAQGSGKKQFVVVSSLRSCLFEKELGGLGNCDAFLSTHSCVDQDVLREAVALLCFLNAARGRSLLVKMC